MLKQVCIQVAYLGNVSESELLKYVCGCESVREKESDWLRLTAKQGRNLDDPVQVHKRVLVDTS